MPRVLIPIDLPDDFRIEHIVAVFDRLDGHPIRKHLMPAGPIRHVDEATARLIASQPSKIASPRWSGRWRRLNRLGLSNGRQRR
jgi:hypothetical protein